MNSLKNSNDLELDIINYSLEEQLKEINKLDNNIFEHNFHSRQDMTVTKEKKILNKVKLYFYAHNFEFEEDNHQKQINKIISIINKNNTRNENKNIFKPLLKPKIISMERKIFYNENNNIANNTKLNDNNVNYDANIDNIIKH